MEENKNTAGSVENAIRKGQIADVSNRNIFKHPVLCAQFLKDFVDRGLFETLEPEDIEDESEKYQAYLGITFETDTVKKIRIKGRGEPLYLISLIEHKSQVDYNISMQILRYMTCIWHEYAQEAEKTQQGISRNKSFKYPPILPIVYYEGMDKWTADLCLKERILMGEFFGSYIPDFTYKLIRIHDYSNEELLDNEDEMSFLVMLNKVQTPKELEAFLNARKDLIDRIIKKASAPILEVIVSTIWSLLMKMNVSEPEAVECIRKVRGHEMGYWFESMNTEDMDIQKARRERDEAKANLKEAQEIAIQAIIKVCQELGTTKEQAACKIMETYTIIDENVAKEKVDLYWKE